MPIFEKLCLHFYMITFYCPNTSKNIIILNPPPPTPNSQNAIKYLTQKYSDISNHCIRQYNAQRI